MKWSEDMKEVIMMRRGLDFRRIEAFIRKFVIMHLKRVLSFIIMIQSFFDYENLIFWSKQILLNITRFIRMTITKAIEHSSFWNTTFIVIIEGFAVDDEIFVSITILTQKAFQSQLNYVIIDRIVVMFFFQFVLNDVIRIVIVKVELNFVKYKTSNVAAYKINDIFNICMFKFQYMINVSFIHKTSSEELRCDWFDSSQIITRVINIYSFTKSDSVHVAWQRRNAL